MRFELRLGFVIFDFGCQRMYFSQVFWRAEIRQIRERKVSLGSIFELFVFQEIDLFNLFFAHTILSGYLKSFNNLLRVWRNWKNNCFSMSISFLGAKDHYFPKRVLEVVLAEAFCSSFKSF